MTYADTQGVIFERIGGWLILPAFLHPIVGVIGNLRVSSDFFKLNVETLPHESQIFIFVIGITSIAFAVAWIISAYLAATLNSIFPRFYIGLVIAGLISTILILTVTTQLFSYRPTPQDYGDLTKEILATLIWVPYMLVSRRVRATFYGVPMPEKHMYSNVNSPLRQAIDSRNEAPEQIFKEDLNMVQRLGMVFYWMALGIAVVVAFIGIFAAFNAPNDRAFIGGACLIVALIVWLIGRACKYVLVGR
jgi:hypothetical protein